MDAIMKKLLEMDKKLDKIDSIEKKLEEGLRREKILERKNRELENKLKLQEERITKVEWELPKHNLVYGIKEKEEEIETNLLTETDQIIQSPGIEFNEQTIPEIRRTVLEPKRKTRPVLLELSNKRKRKEIFRKKKNCITKMKYKWIEKSLPGRMMEQKRKMLKCTMENKATGADLSIMEDSSQDGTLNEKRELVKLPENIPPDILELVDKLTKAALEYKGEGKKRFFSDEVNTHLLSLERKCKVLGKSSRVKVYEHLAYYIKVRRETLIRRAKNLALEDEEKRVKRLTDKLKTVVGNTMPTLISAYEQECQKVLQKKFSKEGQNEENKNLKLPRRKFPWTEETKKLLKDIMFSKKKCFVFEGKLKDNLEELLVNFLRSSILPIWPEGWMSINNLKKVFNSTTENSQTRKSHPESSKNNSNAFKDNQSHTKHSNLTITPVNPKSNSSKAEVTNSVTVTKIANDNLKAPAMSNGNNSQSEMSVSNSHLLKKMIDELGRNTMEAENKNAVPTSSYKEFEKVIYEKDYSTKKILNLDPPKPKQNEVFKPYADVTDPPKTWAGDTFISTAIEQSMPTDYSKYRQSDEKSHRQEDKKHSWQHHGTTTSKHRQEETSIPAESSKQNRHSDSLSSKHIHHNEASKHSVPKPSTISSDVYNPRHNEIPKSSVISESFKHIGDMLKLATDKSHESRHKLGDSGVIVVNTHPKDEIKPLPKNERNDPSTVIPKTSHCQLIDLSNDTRNKPKIEDPRPFKFTKDPPRPDLKSPDLFSEKSLPNPSNFYPEPKKLSHKYQDFSSNSNFLTSSTPKASKSDGDDIQKVMENLRALQKLSCSPVKNDTSTSSPVSVIAYNKNFSVTKSNSSSHTSHSTQRSDLNNKSDFTNSLHDDFQKQFINSLQQLAANPTNTKPNYRCS